MALAILFLFCPFVVQSQCLNSRPITTTNGDTVVFLCPGGVRNTVNVLQFNYGMPFATALTDTKDIVIRYAQSSLISFAGLPEGEYRIYGYTFKGFLNDITGKHLHSNPLTSYCYTKSSNFIKVIVTPPVAPIIDAQSNAPLFICGPDQKYDSIKIGAQFPVNNSKIFLVVNESDKIVSLSSNSLLNGDSLNCKTCKIYAAGYTGKLIIKNGNPVTSPVSDDCYSISKNYLLIQRDLPKAGIISLKDNDSSLFICSESKKEINLQLQMAGNSGGNLQYIITDSADNILEIKADATLSTRSLQQGVCKIYGLMYTGKIHPGLIGKKMAKIILSDDCFAVTTNAVIIRKQKPNAGQIVFKNQSFDKVCLGDTSKKVELERFNSIGTNHRWIITDESGTIERVEIHNLTPGSWKKGNKKIYTVSYTGNFKLKEGLKISDPVSDDCFDVSKDFISILVDLPDAGSLTFSDLSTVKFVCASDTVNLTFNLVHTGFNTFNKKYLLTDANDILLQVSDSGRINIASLKNGFYRLYALSFSGNLEYKLGGNFQALKSSECHSFSSNFVAVTKSEARATSITFANQKDTLFQCAGAVSSKTPVVQVQAPLTKQSLLVTTPEDILLKVYHDSIDQNALGSGLFKIRTISYTDTFIYTLGKEIDEIKTNSGCLDIHAKSIFLVRDLPKGGKIFLSNSDSSYQICARDGWADMLSLLTNSGSKLKYRYVITDTSNTLVSVDAVRENLELLPLFNLKVYGISYNGIITVKTGEKLDINSFATDCADQSENFIAISGTEISAGSLRTEKGETEINICADSKFMDTIHLIINGASSLTKTAWLGINGDTIQFITDKPQLFSQKLPFGTTKIYTVAYFGSIKGKAGDLISKTRLVDSCFGLSTNFITVNKLKPEAGKIRSGNGNTVYLCPSDNNADIVNFNAIGSNALNFAYLIVNSSDSIVHVSKESLIDFDSYPLGICRVYGISFTGELLAKGKFISAADLTTDCFSLSSDFVTVIKSEADAGKVSLASGDTTISFCVEDLGSDTLRFKTSSNVQFKYALLVTNTSNRIQYILSDLSNLYEFNGYDPGQYKIYGLSYGGILLAGRNDLILSARLATGCYKLSTNFIQLNLTNTGATCKNIGVNTDNTAFIAAYPNPATDRFTVTIKPSLLKRGKPELALISASGGAETKIILDRQMIENQQIEIKTNRLTPGMYFLLFKNGYIFDRIKVMIVK